MSPVRINSPAPPAPSRGGGAGPAGNSKLDGLLAAAAKLKKSDGPEGVEPLISPREAQRLRAALSRSPEVSRQVLALVAGFKGEGAPVASALLLRATSARADRLDDPRTLTTLETFAAAMKGQGSAQLRERATVLDLDSRKNDSGFDPLTMWEKRGTVNSGTTRDAAGDNDGLFQRFTSTCGPTVLQMVMAEADPVLAFAINAGGRTSPSTHDGTAKFQRAVLEEFGGVGIGRLEAKLSAQLKNGLGRLVLAGEVTGPQRDALLRNLKGQGALDGRAKNALVALREQYGGFPSDAELDTVRKGVLPARDVGVGTTEFQQALDKYVKALTGVQYTQTAPPDGFGRRQAGKHLDAVEAALRRGIDVPFGVCEPAHWMLLTGVKGQGDAREFQVADPDGGRTAWVKQADLVSGVFGDRQFHLNRPDEKPYIDSFYLPAR